MGPKFCPVSVTNSPPPVEASYAPWPEINVTTAVANLKVNGDRAESWLPKDMYTFIPTPTPGSDLAHSTLIYATVTLQSYNWYDLESEELELEL